MNNENENNENEKSSCSGIGENGRSNYGANESANLRAGEESSVGALGKGIQIQRLCHNGVALALIDCEAAWPTSGIKGTIPARVFFAHHKRIGTLLADEAVVVAPLAAYPSNPPQPLILPLEVITEAIIQIECIRAKAREERNQWLMIGGRPTFGRHSL